MCILNFGCHALSCSLSPTVLPFLPTFPPFFHLALGCYYILNYINVSWWFWQFALSSCCSSYRFSMIFWNSVHLSMVILLWILPNISILFQILQVADNYYRPDLTKAALARLSAVNRSLKVAKSGVKKRNRQALKIRGRKWSRGLSCFVLWFHCSRHFFSSFWSLILVHGFSWVVDFMSILKQKRIMVLDGMFSGLYCGNFEHLSLNALRKT